MNLVAFITTTTRLVPGRIYPNNQSLLIGLRSLFMNTAPQGVTQHYISNLINRGRNREFDIASIARQITVHDDVCVGVYFEVVITRPNELELVEKVHASGATISQAVRRALEKHGVTFR